MEMTDDERAAFEDRINHYDRLNQTIRENNQTESGLKEVRDAKQRIEMDLVDMATKTLKYKRSPKEGEGLKAWLDSIESNISDELSKKLKPELAHNPGSEASGPDGSSSCTIA